jgi:hypothetical protein
MPKHKPLSLNQTQLVHGGNDIALAEAHSRCSGIKRNVNQYATFF